MPKKQKQTPKKPLKIRNTRRSIICGSKRTRSVCLTKSASTRNVSRQATENTMRLRSRQSANTAPLRRRKSSQMKSVGSPKNARTRRSLRKRKERKRKSRQDRRSRISWSFTDCSKPTRNVSLPKNGHIMKVRKTVQGQPETERRKTTSGKMPLPFLQAKKAM